MRLKALKTIVPYKLARELQAAGVPLKRAISLLPHNGLDIPLVNEDAIDEYRAIIEMVIEAHDGIDDIANAETDAEQRVKNIPGWATWTEAEALAWFTENIEPLNIPADVKTLLKAYGRVLLALRDKNWPELNKE